MAHKTYLLIYIFIFCALSSALAEQRPISFGHNLSPSTETMAARQWTAGTYYLGTGLTDHLTVGLSPWIALGYNLENYIIKYSHQGIAEDEVSHQLAYFHNDDRLGNRYKQTSMAYWLTYGRNFDIDSRKYKFSTTLGYMYFWKEEIPFSLRREPFNNQAQQVSLTTLHQFYFSDSTILQFEAGILGLNYKYPNLAAGASWLHFFGTSWSMQVGASISKRLSGPEGYAEDGAVYINYFENYMRDSIHPELQLQYWF